MENFRETNSPPKLNQEEIDQVNETITRKKWICNKNTPYKKKGQMASEGILSNIQRRTYTHSSETFQKLEEEGTHPKIFYDATIVLIPK